MLGPTPNESLTPRPPAADAPVPPNNGATRKRVLVVEDDAALTRVLFDALRFEGFIVECVADGDLVLKAVGAFIPDLIVLDITLPHRDGFDLCGVLRRDGAVPILMLSARSEKSDKLRGLGLGADDYVTKPFELEELLARVRAILRRTRPAVDRLTLADVTIDFCMLRATRGSETLNLSHREFAVIRFLAERERRVVSRDELLSQLWLYADVPLTRSVDHAIARLRKKIEPDPHRPRFIHTVHGDGYCLTPEGCDNMRHCG